MLYKSLSHIFNFIPKASNAIVSLKDPIKELSLIGERYNEYYSKYKNDKYILDPFKLIIGGNEYLEYKKYFKNIILSIYKVNEGGSSINLSIKKLPSLLINNTYKDPYKSLKDFIKNTTTKVIFCIDRNSLRLELLNMLDSINKK